MKSRRERAARPRAVAEAAYVSSLEPEPEPEPEAQPAVVTPASQPAHSSPSSATARSS